MAKIKKVVVSPNTKLNKMEQSILEEDVKEDSIYLGRRVDHSSGKKSNRLRFNSSHKKGNDIFIENQNSALKHQAKPIESILNQLEILSNTSMAQDQMSVQPFDENDDASSVGGKSFLRNNLAKNR